MPLTVPDASVILKWVLPPDHEEYVEQALAFRNAIVLKGIAVSVPPLWYYEVGNTLARRFPSHAAEYLRELRNFGLPESTPDSRWETAILRLTADYGVTFYDAAYHGLAVARAGMFVSGDERYMARASSAGNLMHIRDWPLS